MTLIGLISNVLGTGFLIKPLFLTDEEINQLSKLPIVETTTNLTGKVGDRSVPIAGIEKESFERFKKTVIKERIEARKMGKFGLYFILFYFSGFFL